MQTMGRLPIFEALKRHRKYVNFINAPYKLAP